MDNRTSLVVAPIDRQVPPGATRPDMMGRELARMLWRRWRSILASSVCAGALALGIASELPRWYQADGLLVVNTQEINIPDFQTVRSEGTVEPWGARSAASMISSRELIETAAKKLDLIADPAFNPNLREKTAFAEFLDWIRRLLPSASTEEASGGQEPWNSEPRETDFDRMISAIRSNLDVLSEERSYAIVVRFAWTDPGSAARLVNGVMQQFVEQERQGQRSVTLEANERLRQQGEELHAALAATQARIRDLENSTDLLTTTVGSVTAQRLVALGNQRQELENGIAGVRADLDQVNAAVASGTANLLNPDLVTPRLRSLMESLSEASTQERLARTVTQLGPKHPRYLELTAQLQNLEKDVRAETTAIRDSLRNRLEALRRQQANLGTEEDSLGRQAALSASRRTALDQLRAEEESQRRLYDVYEERYRQTLANVEVLQPQTRIGARALPPTRPSSPGRSVLAFVGAILGGLAAVGVIVGKEWWYGRIRSFDEVRDLTGVPVLGAIPWLKARTLREIDGNALVKSSASTQLSENVRGILFRLRTSRQQNNQIVQVCSALPGEGKTSLALSLARVAAHEGYRALCIDADFRNPSLAARAGVRPTKFLNDILNLEATLEEALIADPLSGAGLIIARPEEGKSLNHLGVARLQTLLATARERYDVVIVDSSPVLSVVDPLLLARTCDGVVLMVSEKSATRELVKEAVQRFEAVGAHLAGVVVAEGTSSDSRENPYSYSTYPST